MAFTLAQRYAYYHENPKKWNAIVQRYRAKKRRKAEIEGAKQSLLSAHRLRLIGLHINPIGKAEGFDSWEVSHEV